MVVMVNQPSRATKSLWHCACYLEGLWDWNALAYYSELSYKSYVGLTVSYLSFLRLHSVIGVHYWVRILLLKTGNEHACFWS